MSSSTATMILPMPSPLNLAAASRTAFGSPGSRFLICTTMSSRLPPKCGRPTSSTPSWPASRRWRSSDASWPYWMSSLVSLGGRPQVTCWKMGCRRWVMAVMRITGLKRRDSSAM